MPVDVASVASSANSFSNSVFDIVGKSYSVFDREIEEKSLLSDLFVLLNLEKMFTFDHVNTIKDITPKKEDLDLFINWMNNPDNNKWFKIPNEYKKIYEY